MASKGISPEMAEKQLEAFRKGFPKMDIVAPATPERGIKILSGDEIERSLEMYAGAHIAGKRKFVPASGAASRMFRDLFDGSAGSAGGRICPEGLPGSRFRVKNRAFRFLRASDFPPKADGESGNDYMARILETVLYSCEVPDLTMVPSQKGC